MRFRVISLVLFAAALLVFIGVPLEAQDKVKNTHVGKLVSVKGNGFTMEIKAGKTHEHILTLDGKVFDTEGKECKLGDLKKGQQIRVTAAREGDDVMVSKVEALKKKTE